MDHTALRHNLDEEKEVRDIYASLIPRDIFDSMPVHSANSSTTSSDQLTDDEDQYLDNIMGSKHGVEISLYKMGYNQNDPIDWSRAQIPPKTDLHKLLHFRISNFINPDILVRIGNHEYRCHLLVLQSYSMYFFENAGSSIEISEKNVSKSAFTFIYQWMLYHGGDSFKLLRMDNILDIYMAAKFLKIEELTVQCEAFIGNEDLMSEDRAFSLYLDARAIGNTSVMLDMVPRIQRFFLTLVASKDFLEFATEEVCVFLQSNFICVHCEMEVFMSAVRWLVWDWDSRKQNVAQVMSCVRFGLITPWQLVDIRRNPNNPEFLLVTKDLQVTRMIEDGLAFAIVKHGQEASNSEHVIENFGLQEPIPRNWAGSSNVTEQKKYETYQDFLTHLSKYRKLHFQSNKGKGDKSMVSSESLRIETETVIQMQNSPDFILHHNMD